MSSLIYPGHPEFDQVLCTLPPGESDSGDTAFVADSVTGILRAVGRKELDDYLLGGEYDERLQVINDLAIST